MPAPSLFPARPVISCRASCPHSGVPPHANCSSHLQEQQHHQPKRACEAPAQDSSQGMLAAAAGGGGEGWARWAILPPPLPSLHYTRENSAPTLPLGISGALAKSQLRTKMHPEASREHTHTSATSQSLKASGPITGKGSWVLLQSCPPPQVPTGPLDPHQVFRRRQDRQPLL